MADLKVALEDMREESDPRSKSALCVSTPAARWKRTSGVGRLRSLGIGAWRSPVVADASHTAAPDPRPFLTRLTSDVGWTDYPAISLDGKILAYASDRSGDGNLDIWVQQIPDGAPVRLTRHSADEVEPSFSADGSRIAFQSSRQAGGIYVIPTLGGEERLLVARGFSPRFSPDGKWIAYGVAEQAGSRIYVAPAAGGPATPVAAGFYRAQAPVWSPDGRHCCSGPNATATLRRRTTSTGTSRRSRAGARADGSAEVLLREGFQAFQGLPSPDAWVGAGNRILFHGIVGDSSNMWQVAIALRMAGTSAGRHSERRSARQTKRPPRSPRTGGWCSSAGRWARISGAYRSTQTVAKSGGR